MTALTKARKCGSRTTDRKPCPNDAEPGHFVCKECLPKFSPTKRFLVRGYMPGRPKKTKFRKCRTRDCPNVSQPDSDFCAHCDRDE